MKAVGKIWIAAIVIGICLGFAPGLYAQDDQSPERSLAKAKLLYDSGRYQDAFNELVALLGVGKEYDPPTMVEIYKYLAFCYSAYERRELSKKQFKNALKYDPDLKLDPVFTSPKIMEVFEEAKAEFVKEAPPPAPKPAPQAKKPEAKPKQEPEVEETPKVIPAKPAKQMAARRQYSTGATVAKSLIVPGWGQYSTGSKVKGASFAGGALTALALTIFYTQQAFTAEDYYNQASPGEKQTTYDGLTQMITIRNVFIGLTAAVWVASGLDAYLETRAISKRRAGFLAPYAAAGGMGSEVGINYQINF